jgi:hypothetical protein
MALVLYGYYTMELKEVVCASKKMASTPRERILSMNIILKLSTALVLLTMAPVAEAVAMKKGPPLSSYSSQGGGGKSSGRDWLISVPVMTERPQLRVHLEYNAAKSVGLALEGGVIGNNEELPADEVKKSGNSLMISGAQGSLMMSRYSDQANLGGFFWTVGAGYRVWTADWKKQPDEKEASRMSLVDEKGYLHHRAQGRGVTGHLRGGYRYVANEWPLAIGAHIGIRHLNSQVKDKEVNESEQQKMGLAYSDLSAEEKKGLRHRMMSEPDIAVDIGMVF